MLGRAGVMGADRPPVTPHPVRDGDGRGSPTRSPGAMSPLGAQGVSPSRAGWHPAPLPGGALSGTGAVGLPGLEGHTASAVADVIIVYGGRSSATELSGAVYALHLRSSEWRPVRCRGYAPLPRCYHSACVYGGRLLIFGGLLAVGVDDAHYNNYNVFVADDLLPAEARERKGAARLRVPDTLPQVAQAAREAWCYHELDLIGPAQWDSPAHKGDLPEARSHHSAGVSGDTMYIYGGYSVHGNGRAADERTKSLYCVNALDLATKTWRRIEASGSIPPMLWGCAAAFIDGILITHGGVDALTGREEDYLCAWHKGEKEWRWLLHGDHRAPGPLAQHTAVEHQGRLLVFGGCRDVASQLSNRVHSFDLGTGEWRAPGCTGEAPEPRRGHAAVVAPDTGKMIVVGGVDAAAHRTLRCHVLDPASWEWSPLSATFSPAPVDNVAADVGPAAQRRLLRLHRARARRAASPQLAAGSPGAGSGPPSEPGSDDGAAAEMPPELKDIRWETQTPNWESFCARPENKAFAVTAPDPATGKRWWYAHWGAQSLDDAVAVALGECRRRGFSAQIVWPPQLRGTHAPQSPRHAPHADPGPGDPPRAPAHPHLYSQTPVVPYLSRPAVRVAGEGEGASSSRAQQANQLQALGHAVFFAGPLGLPHRDPLQHHTRTVDTSPRARATGDRYGFVDLAGPLPSDTRAAPAPSPYSHPPPHRRASPTHPQPLYEQAAQDERRYSPKRLDLAMESPAGGTPSPFRAADDPLAPPFADEAGAHAHWRRQVQHQQTQPASPQNPAEAHAAAARDAAGRAWRLFADRSRVRRNTQRGRQRYTSPSIVKLGLVHKLAANQPEGLQGPFGGSDAAAHPYGRSLARDVGDGADGGNALPARWGDGEGADGYVTTTTTAIPHGLGPISAAAFLTGLQQVQQPAEAVAGAGEALHEIQQMGDAGEAEEAEMEAEAALMALPADLRNAAALAYRDRWQQWGWQDRLDATVHFADAQGAGHAPVLPPPDAGAEGWPSQQGPLVAPQGPLIH